MRSWSDIQQGITRSARGRSGLDWALDWPWTSRYKLLWLNGRRMPLATIGAVAEAVGRGVSTVRLWEATGVLPPARIREGVGAVRRLPFRLYLPEYVAGLELLAAQYGISSSRRGPEQMANFSKAAFALDVRVWEQYLFTVGEHGQATG